jgi:hypothetical protein
MVKITLKDGTEYIGKDARDIIVQLKLEDWTIYDNVEAYKNNIARRVKIFKNEQISYSNDKEFLQELERIGFINKIVVDF